MARIVFDIEEKRGEYRVVKANNQLLGVVRTGSVNHVVSYSGSDPITFVNYP